MTANDLKQSAIDLFKEKAISSDRLTAENVDVENNVLMENLRLYDEHNLVRAAIMAFHKDPEKWIGGAYIKIGYFVTDADLRYQDEIHGPLIEQVDKAEELVYTKYMKALIDYEGIQRVEKFMFPRNAFREILLNAVVHKDYSGCNPIQISVYEDRMYIYNDGIMPEELSSTDKLFAKHSSKPFNPKLAGVFFKSGMIEAWGRGFEKIREACDAHGTTLPEFQLHSHGVMAFCKPNEKYMEMLITGKSAQKGIQYMSEYERIVSESLTEREKISMAPILAYLREHNTIDNGIGRDLTGKSSATVRRYLSRLCEVRLLVLIGATKDANYRRTSDI